MKHMLVTSTSPPPYFRGGNNDVATSDAPDGYYDYNLISERSTTTSSLSSQLLNALLMRFHNNKQQQKIFNFAVDGTTNNNVVDNNYLIGGDGELSSSSFSAEMTTREAAIPTTTIKPDIIVGFVFLGLSAVLLLFIIILCIYIQRPFKKIIRWYRHVERKRILAKMGVDEIHDLHYEAGFIPKAGKPTYRRNRLISQQFDEIIDLEPDHVHPHNHFYQQHAALMTAKRMSIRPRSSRWSQSERHQHRPSTLMFQPHQQFVHRISSLPSFDDDDDDEPPSEVFTPTATEPPPTQRNSSSNNFESATTVDSSSGSNNNNNNNNKPSGSPKKAQLHLLHHQHHRNSNGSSTNRLQLNSEATNFSEDEFLDGTNETALMSEATLGVESVSKNTPQSLVIQEIVAKSRRASIAVAQQALLSRKSLPQNKIGEIDDKFTAIAGRRRSLTTTAAVPVSALKKINGEHVIGRFHIYSSAHGNALITASAEQLSPPMSPEPEEHMSPSFQLHQITTPTNEEEKPQVDDDNELSNK